MAYYFEHQQKQIAAPLAYGIVTAIIISLVFVMNKVSINTNTRASGKQAQLVTARPSTISTNGAIIHAVTASPSVVSVRYWEKQNKSPRVALDSRDVSKAQSRSEHFIPLAGLRSQTDYEYEVIANGKLLSRGSLKTYAPSDVGKAQQPLFGKIVTQSLTPLSQALVVISFDGTKDQYYSALSDESGNWIVNIPIVKDERGKSIVLSPEQKVKVTVYANGKRSRAESTYASSSPLRTIVIGKDYQSDEGVLGSSSALIGKNLQILSPSDGSIIPSRYIRIRGIAKPNSPITVQLQGETLTAQSDNEGIWSVQNTIPLMAGTYTVAAQTPSEQAVTQIRFSVGKDGEQVLGNATESPTIIPTATPTQSVTQPTAVATVIPTTTPAIPQSGFNTNILIIGASSLSLLGLFLLLY